MPRGDKTGPGPRGSKTLSAVDVYDLASGVKEEFERVIEVVGNEPLVLLVSKVVDVLEHLERLTQVLQMERGELEDLRLIVEKQKSCETLGAAEKENNQKEREILEKSWKREAEELTEYAAKLQEENLVLRLNVEELKNESQSSLKSRQELSQMAEEIQILREKMFSQKDELIQLKQNLIQKESEIEALQQQLDRFTKLNTDYRTRYSASNRQIQQLLDEKAELESLVRETSPEDFVQLRKKKTRNSENENAATSRYGCRFRDGEFLSTGEDGISLDIKNPDIPRYSETEMTKVLQTCKDLKAQLMEAKAELSIYRPDLVGEGGGDDDDDDDEGAVQGPINEEPEEKLFPEKFQKPTAIQRLFQNFLRGSSKSTATTHKK